MKKDRRQIWDVSSVSFLIYIIFAIIVIFAGFIVVDSETIHFLNSIIFFIVCFIPSAILLFFLRAAAIPVLVTIILLVYFSYNSGTEGYLPFSQSNSFVIKTLLKKDNAFSLEITDFFNEVTFLTIEGDVLYPVFSIVDFPDSLFFLKNSSFVRFEGIISDNNSFSDQLESVYLKSTIGKLPFAQMRKYELQAIEKSVYSIFKIDLNSNGTFSFK
ncbi:MAG: hypothetical protein PF570_05765 [Candidatus Cloacimonetes bacterium]|nr:hypothetical protein [Candidatus Cloacimonadota bacterium]